MEVHQDSGLWDHFHQFEYAGGRWAPLCEVEEPSTPHQCRAEVLPGNPSLVIAWVHVLSLACRFSAHVLFPISMRL